MNIFCPRLRGFAARSVLALAALLIRSRGRAQTYEILHEFPPSTGTPSSPLILGSDGNLYGTAAAGGALGQGSVYMLTPIPGPGYTYVELHSFSGADGARPLASLLESGGEFYGTTQSGGDSGLGTVFRMDGSGTVTVLHSFSGADGSGPTAPLASSGGTFLGAAREGGTLGRGTIYSISAAGAFEKLHDFEGPEGFYPSGGLTPVAGGVAYGTTQFGGDSNDGAIYRLETDGTVSLIHSFARMIDGSIPTSTLIWDGAETLFGTTNSGPGFFQTGTVFSLTLDGDYSVLFSFVPSQGSYPHVTRSNSGTIYGAAAFEGANGFGTLFQLDTDSTFTVLANFDFPGPAYPVAEPLLLADGTLVGSANYGGAFGTGALYTFPVGGPLSIIHSFGSSDGAVPISGLHQHTDGLIYGTTTSGGNGYGTVFRFTLAGALDYVHLFEFDGIDGSNPQGGLIAGPGGELFGTTLSGGDEGLGTIYKIDAAGEYAQTHSLVEAEGGTIYDALTYGSDGNLYCVTSAGNGTAIRSADGIDFDFLHAFTFDEAYGVAWSLAEGPDGNYYGAASGAGDRGTVYRLTPAGNVTVAHSFLSGSAEGESPSSALVTAPWGLMYGVNGRSGPGGAGTAFAIDTEGRVRVLHGFSGPDGQYPSSLALGSSGLFFGTTYEGGAHGVGTLFQLDKYGNFLKLHDFDLPEGGTPESSVVEASDGNIYGTTDKGGTGGLGQGVVFRFAMPVRALAVSPSSGDALGGTALTVSGRGFADGVSVDIGGQTTAVLGNSPTDITTSSPPLFPGTLNDVLVANTDGTSSVLPEGWFADYLDVPAADQFHPYVETLVRHHVAVGIGGGFFGSKQPTTRAQLAVFLLKAARGAAIPPACTGAYNDVACPSLFADWVEELGAIEITAGCNDAPPLYCPTEMATRAQMAVFVLKAARGSAYTPPPCSGVFEDVPCPGGFAVDWIEDLYAAGVTNGCSKSPLLYCPDDPVSRGQMAVFVVGAFHLP